MLSSAIARFVMYSLSLMFFVVVIGLTTYLSSIESSGSIDLRSYSKHEGLVLIVLFLLGISLVIVFVRTIRSMHQREAPIASPLLPVTAEIGLPSALTPRTIAVLSPPPSAIVTEPQPGEADDVKYSLSRLEMSRAVDFEPDEVLAGTSQSPFQPFGRPEGAGDINFERDFGQWFKPDKVLADATPQPLIQSFQPGGVGDISFERDFGQWFVPDEALVGSMNMPFGGADEFDETDFEYFERDFGQWFDPSEARPTRRSLQTMHNRAPGQPGMMTNAGSSADPGFNPGLGGPNRMGGPPGTQQKPMGMLRPPLPGMGRGRQGGDKDVKPDPSPNNMPESIQGSGTGPVTPVTATNPALDAPALFPMGNDMLLSSQDFVNTIASGLDDFDPSAMFGRSDDEFGDINFERDFGQWFNNPDDTLTGTSAMFGRSDGGVDDLEFERDPEHWFNHSDDVTLDMSK